jgi:hypothetical protein
MDSIEYKSNRRVISLSDLKPGDVFKHENELYIKAKSYGKAFSLERNEMITFVDIAVKKYNSKLILKEE